MSGFFTELFRALFQATLPLAAFSFALIWWAIKRGYFKGEGGVRALDREVKEFNKNRKLEKKQRKQAKKNGEEPAGPGRRKTDPVAEKWLAFGGGFYGLVAFYTYVLIEWDEIVEFVANFGGFWSMVSNISVGAIISLIINSIMNFIAALIWPVYWMGKAATEWLWLWLVAAYAGYWLGTKCAQHAVMKQWGFDVRWPLGLKDEDED